MKKAMEKKGNMTAANMNAIHDITQLVKEDCLTLIEDSHVLASKYHAELLVFANSNLSDSLHHKDQILALGKQAFQHMINSLQLLLPRIDKLSLNDIEISSSLNQIISCLEYLRFEFLRHLYLINTFYTQLDDQVSLLNFDDRSEVSRVTIISFSFEMKISKKQEIKQIKRDINQIEKTITKMSEKYYIFIPDLEDIRVWNKRSLRGQKRSSFRIFTKFRFMCCLCSPEYI